MSLVADFEAFARMSGDFCCTVWTECKGAKVTTRVGLFYGRERKLWPISGCSFWDIGEMSLEAESGLWGAG